MCSFIFDDLNRFKLTFLLSI